MGGLGGAQPSFEVEGAPRSGFGRKLVSEKSRAALGCVLGEKRHGFQAITRLALINLHKLISARGRNRLIGFPGHGSITFWTRGAPGKVLVHGHAPTRRILRGYLNVSGHAMLSFTEHSEAFR